MNAEEYIEKLGRAGIPRPRAASSLFALENAAVSTALKYVFERREIPTAAELAAWKEVPSNVRTMPASEVLLELDSITPELERRERALAERRRADGVMNSVSQGLAGLEESLWGSAGARLASLDPGAGPRAAGGSSPPNRGSVTKSFTYRLPDLAPAVSGAQEGLYTSLASLAESITSVSKSLAERGIQEPARSFTGPGGVLSEAFAEPEAQLLRAAETAVDAAMAQAAQLLRDKPDAEPSQGPPDRESQGPPPPSRLAPGIRQAILSSIETNESLLEHLRASVDAEADSLAANRRASELSDALMKMAKGSPFSSIAGDPAELCPDAEVWRAEASRAAQGLARAKALCHTEMEAAHYSYSTLQLLRAALEAQRAFLGRYRDTLRTLSGAIRSAVSRARAVALLAERESDLRLGALADASSSRAWAEGTSRSLVEPLEAFAAALKECQGTLYLPPAEHAGLLSSGEAILGQRFRGPRELVDSFAHAYLRIGDEGDAGSDGNAEGQQGQRDGPDSSSSEELAGLTDALLSLQRSVLSGVSARFGDYLQNPRDLDALRGQKEEICVRGLPESL